MFEPFEDLLEELNGFPNLLNSPRQLALLVGVEVLVDGLLAGLLFFGVETPDDSRKFSSKFGGVVFEYGVGVEKLHEGLSVSFALEQVDQVFLVQ